MQKFLKLIWGMRKVGYTAHDIKYFRQTLLQRLVPGIMHFTGIFP
jgi:hypothetical protein